MATTPPTDPFAFFRDMVGQWEKYANEHGAKALQTPEVAKQMQGVTAAGLQIQQSVHEAMSKVLATANMPSRDDFTALAARVAAMEGQLTRIEAALGAAPVREGPRPKRTRQPPKPA